MKTVVIILLGLLFVLSVYPQTNKVQGELSTSDTADLAIINISPDSFPNISVVFRAETRSHEPVWNLTADKMQVKENGGDCEVLSLEQLSKNRAINIYVVVDHSGSMAQDLSQLFDEDGKELFSYADDGSVTLPSAYLPPIDNAKIAVKNFAAAFNAEKDFIGVIGFSNRVDRILPLTNERGKINEVIDSMQADFSTALYDAMMTGLMQIRDADGAKVLVVLTDGQDNASRLPMSSVINKAKEENIPIYIVGLGEVNTDTLQMIADATNGRFYYTRSSTSLNYIYADISKHVQAFYNLVYKSPNLASADDTREIEISFATDSLFLLTTPGKLNLPTEVVEHLKTKEQVKEVAMYGGVAILLLIGAGTLLYRYRSKNKVKNAPVIHAVFPNPTTGPLTVNYTSAPGTIQIFDMSGIAVMTMPVDGNNIELDLSALPPNNYLAIVTANGLASNSIQIIVQH